MNLPCLIFISTCSTAYKVEYRKRNTLFYSIKSTVYQAIYWMRNTLLTPFYSTQFLAHFNSLQFISVHISHSPSVSNAFPFPIPIRIYKFSASRLPQSRMLIEFFSKKICLHFWILFDKRFCVIISKFEIASRAPADTADSGHDGRLATTWTASVRMMISPRSNIIIAIAVVCACLFVARAVALPLWRWALAKCYLEEVHTEIKCVWMWRT